MPPRYHVRPARPSEHGFVMSRALGEFRRARIQAHVVKAKGTLFLRALLARADARCAVVEADDVLVGGGVSVAGGVVALHMPEPIRALDLLLEVLEVMGVVLPAPPAAPEVRWLVPPPWWAQRELAVVHDPFSLVER